MSFQPVPYPLSLQQALAPITAVGAPSHFIHGELFLDNVLSDGVEIGEGDETPPCS